MRFILSLSAVVLGAASVVLAACGGKTGTSSSSSSASAALTALVTASCNDFAQCEPITFQRLYGDVDACIRVKSQTEAGASSAVSNAALAACTQAIESGGCGAPGSQSEACSFHGTVPIGGACSETQLCVAGATCPPFNNTSCGTCVAYATAGRPCANVACAPGLVCNEATNMCVTPIVAGGACGPIDTPCAGTYVCLGGTCSPPLENGASCVQNPSACNESDDVYCTGGTCVAPSLAQVGQPCGTMGASCFGLDVLCVPTDGTGASVCVAPLAAGSPCGDNGPMCEFPANCVNGVCSEQGEDAGTCP